MGSHITTRPCLWERVARIARGLKKKKMLEVYCFENSSGIYLRHPWPSRSTGRNIEDSTEEHTGTVLLKHLQDRRNGKRFNLMNMLVQIPDIQRSCR